MMQHPSSASLPADASGHLTRRASRDSHRNKLRSRWKRANLNRTMGSSPIVTQDSPPSLGDDGARLRGAKVAFELSPSKLHELDRASQKLDSPACAVFKDVCGFGRIDLVIVSPSHSMCGLSESVTGPNPPRSPTLTEKVFFFRNTLLDITSAVLAQPQINSQWALVEMVPCT